MADSTAVDALLSKSAKAGAPSTCWREQRRRRLGGSVCRYSLTAPWERVIGVNLNGAFYCARAAVKQMQEDKGGAIVNISSAPRLVSGDGPALLRFKGRPDGDDPWQLARSWHPEDPL